MFKLPDPDKKYFWIFLAIIIKGIILSFFIYESHSLTPERMVSGVVVKQNDYGFFLGVVDNYFSTGIMTYIENKPFAGRMPGYGIPYLLLRYVFPQNTALLFLIFFQFILSSVSVYLLAKTSLIFTGNKKSFYFSFLVFSLSIYTGLYDIFTLSESFSVSAMIFTVYFLVSWQLERANWKLLTAGFFLAWAVFLRPFLGIFIPVFTLILFIWQLNKINFKTGITVVLLFISPFILFESLWVYRNYKVLGRFIPLETDMEESYGKYTVYRNSTTSVRALINAWGGEAGEFYDNSEGWWFHFTEGEDVKSYSFPSRIFNSGFNKDSLIALKQIYNAGADMKLSPEARDSMNLSAINIAERYRNQYIHTNKLRYYLLNPFVRIKKLVFSNPTLTLPLPKFQEMNFIEKILKIGYTGLYFLVLIFGSAGMLFYLLKMKRSFTGLLLIAIPVTLIITIISISDIFENRYFVNAYSPLIIFASVSILFIQNRLNTRNTANA
jgi:hypothetical protein